MKVCTFVIAMISWVSVAYAGPPSIMGAKPMGSNTAHHMGLGWPSVFYEYWRAGNPDWGIGGELVYGDWSGDFSDVEIGGALNVPLRWRLSDQGRTAIAFRLAPGALIASVDGGPFNDRFAAGIRCEMGIPVSVDLHEKVNLITGGNIPASVYFIENSDPFVVIPILGRIGAEVEAKSTITPYVLVELGSCNCVRRFWWRG